MSRNSFLRTSAARSSASVTNTTSLLRMERRASSLRPPHTLMAMSNTSSSVRNIRSRVLPRMGRDGSPGMAISSLRKSRYWRVQRRAWTATSRTAAPQSTAVSTAMSACRSPTQAVRRRHGDEEAAVGWLALLLDTFALQLQTMASTRPHSREIGPPIYVETEKRQKLLSTGI